jgi:hypothetical protein
VTTRQRSEGFGFIPQETEHHFLITIFPSKKEQVYISEHFTWEEDLLGKRSLSLAPGNEDDKLRAILSRSKWDAIADMLQEDFNRRLKKNGLKAGHWKVGQTPLSRLLGKEAVLLAWAVEDADPALIPIAIRNWQGLTPEERWWLFTMTNAATGHAITGRGKGWRKAVRYALSENPVSDVQPVRRDDLFLIMEDRTTWGSQRAVIREQRAEAEASNDPAV